MKYWIAPLLFIILTFSPLIAEGPIQARLITNAQVIEPGVPFEVAIEFEMEDDWHIYWKNPGNVGAPTEIRWQLPVGFHVVETFWPSPKRFEDLGMLTYGYSKKAIVIASISTPKAIYTDTVSIQARATWLACDELCIPGDANLNITLPVGALRQNIAAGRVLEEARGQLPQALEQTTAHAYLSGKEIELAFDNPIFKNLAPESFYFFPENSSIISKLDQNARITETGVTLQLILEEETIGKLSQVKGVLAIGDQKSYNIDIATEPALPPTLDKRLQAETQTLSPWIKALVMAFIGGILLNLMPCVFPVIGIKVMGFVQQSKESQSKAMLHGIVFASGILLSFIILASLLMAFKSAGKEIGWGFQLQSPFFIVFLIGLFFLIGLSFIGALNWGNKWISVGQKAQSKPGLIGTFFTGVLATVVATPCTGPFMGVALGYALAQPPLKGLAVFISLGLGMSSPYLLLAARPKLIQYLPRPGAWMEALRQILAFPLFASVIWLLWVLGRQIDSTAIIGVLFGLLIMSAGVWVHTFFGRIRGAAQVPTLALILSFFLVGAGFANSFMAVKSSSPSELENTLQWSPYSEERLSTLREQGTGVFIDFTAAWCLSCQANKYTTLNKPEVVRAFKDNNIIPLVADWTHQDPVITQALERYERSGVPLYIYYPAGGAEPVILPAILSPSIVINAIQEN